MTDQRQFVRKSLQCMVSIFNEQGTSIGNMVDYSEGGIMVSSYRPIDVDVVFKVAMVDLPNNIGRKRTGYLTIKSVWSDQLMPSMFGTGFELIEADEQAKAMFASYDKANLAL